MASAVPVRTAGVGACARWVSVALGPPHVWRVPSAAAGGAVRGCALRGPPAAPRPAQGGRSEPRWLLACRASSEERQSGLGEAPPLRSIDEPSEPAAPPVAPSAPSVAAPAAAKEPPGWLANAVTALAGAGFVETIYLAVAKLSGSQVACPTDGCNAVLASGYSELFGVPLPLFGAAAYATAVLLSRLAKAEPAEKTYWWALLGLSTLMASSSAFLVYVILFRLEAECVYCFGSAALSSLLLAASLQAFSRKELARAVAPQLALSASVVLGLTLAFSDVDEATASLDFQLPYIEPMVSTVSQPWQVALAKHLSEAGAKFYGAFWCGHCFEQKLAFGEEAARYLPYVECYPSGFRRGASMADACEKAGVDGFPMWIINGEVLSGDQELSVLAKKSGFRS